MKQLMITPLLIFALLVGYQPVDATIELIQLKVSVSSNIAGEKANYLFSLSPVSKPIEKEQWITIIAPEDIYIPPSIDLSDIYINQTTHPVKVEILQNQHIQMLVPPITEKYLTFYFEKSGQFTNPFHNEPVNFTLVWESRSFMITSEAIRFEYPSSSIEITYSETPIDKLWFNKPVMVTLNSNLAVSIYYTINEGEEQLYTESILFQQGRYEIQAYGMRSSGISEEAVKISVWVDTKAPIIKIMSPKDNLITNQVSTYLMMSIFDQSKVTVTARDQVHQVEPTGQPVEISIPITLQDGENRITWKAQDEVGFTTTGSLTVNLDTTPPALKIYSPRKGEIICGDRVEVTGKSEPGSKLTMGEKSIPLDVLGNFSTFLVPEKGPNTLELRCSDPAGNETLIQIDYMYYAGKIVEIWIEKETAKIEGKEIPINPPPVIEPESEEIYLPLRFIPSVLDYKLEWDSTEGVAVLTRKQVQILIRPNDSKIRIKTASETESVELTHPPLLMNKVVMIPSEFLKKILGAELLYYQEEKRLLINFCDRSE